MRGIVLLIFLLPHFLVKVKVPRTHTIRNIHLTLAGSITIRILAYCGQLQLSANLNSTFKLSLVFCANTSSNRIFLYGHNTGLCNLFSTVFRDKGGVDVCLANRYCPDITLAIYCGNLRVIGCKGNLIRKDADGNTARKGKVDITDGMRFESSDENIFTVGATKGKLTAVGEGEATLKVWAVQSEGRDPETGEYKATTPIKEYTVKVLAKPIEVLQTAYNKFIMTFPNHEEAEVARKGIQAALDTAYAHVSEETNLVKIYKVLADSKNERREVFARAVGYYNGTDNTLVVTMFNELEEQTRYVINYKNHPDMFIDTPEYVAEDLTLEGYRIEADKDHSVQGIHAYLYTRDKNTNNKILIGTNEPDSSCARYLRWYDGLELEDVTGLETNSDYQFDAYEGRVYFYGTDRNLKVKVKGNFEDWIRNVTGRVTKTITGYGELTPYGDEIEVKNFNWCIVHEGPKYDTWWLNWGDKKIASDDKGYYLVVKADIKELGEDFKTKGSNQGGVDDFFTFKSLNDDKLPVNMESGEIYPPKAVLNETVGVVVYYKDQYVGTCPGGYHPRFLRFH